MSDLLLVNGRIWPAPPYGADAAALLIRGGRVAAVGSDAELSIMAVGARTVDLRGAAVLPGFIDAHCHLLWYGEALSRWVDLRGTTTLEEIQARLRQRVAACPPAPGEWILGRAFDQDRLPGARMPLDTDLDAVAPGVPILIERVCGHALVASTAAQAAAGVRAPGGFFADEEMPAVWKAVPPATASQKVAAAELACRRMAEAGFTGAHCIVPCREDVEAFRDLAGRGALPIHLRLMVSDPALLDPLDTREVLPCHTLKLFADGSLGAHTAALSEPYTDVPDTRGRLLLSQAELDERVSAAHRAGYQVAVHAIGDAAIAGAVEAIARAQAGCPRPDARHRIEHASVLPPALVDRLSLVGILAVVQPQFVGSDFWTAARLGPARAGWAYPFRSLWERGVPLAGGTDCPVEVPDPFQAISQATARLPAEQRLSVAQAITLFTRGAANAGFQESARGALTPGCWADLIVLPADPRDLPAAQVASLRPELTLVAGRVAYSAGEFLDLSEK